jgi:hypothetical protein
LSILNCLAPPPFLVMEPRYTHRDCGGKSGVFFELRGLRQSAFAICASPGSIFKYATRRRIAADLVELLEADAMAVGGSVSRPALATASGAGRTLRTRGVADRNRPSDRSSEGREHYEECSRGRHSIMLATTPAPTVRPPSRMAKRSFSSIAIGTIRCTSMAMLSPGITISVPSGRCTTPVTSVVRK